MTTMRFNAITYSNRLKHAVDKNEMADIQAEELSNIINNDLATKQDLLNTKNDLKNEIQLLDNKLTSLENRIIIRLTSVMISCSVIISLTLAVVGFLLKGN